MNLPVTERFKTTDASEVYGIERWANGYLAIREDGHLLVTPRRDPGSGVSLLEAVAELERRGLRTPVLLRFPQLLEGQLAELVGAFRQAIEEYHYAKDFLPVFPVKVNQQRSVLESLLSCGAESGLGLEVGSRPELMLAAALPTSANSLIICNGFKDAEYLSTAALATKLGKRVVVVLEKPFELDSVLRLADRMRESGDETGLPLLGFRLRLQARGSGLWEKSGGFAAKFGLTTLELLRLVDRLASAGLRDRLALLHFHIGSQITEIRKVKSAILEAGRVYAKLRKMGIDIRYLDVGGGLGIDYDGSKTSGDASVNYNAQEYANDIVFGISEVCEQEGVEPPTIITESGRWTTAYHSVLVTDVRGVIDGIDPHPPQITGDEPQVVQDLAEVSRTITVKNYREFYHDAIAYRDQMQSLFNLGLLGLEDRAKSECLFWTIAGQAVRHSKTAKFIAEEFIELDSKLHDKYICNFSVFQSLPDHWALDQLFPVMPIHRLNEPPTRKATLVDITCDSDGEVEKFVDLRDIKGTLEVHEVVPGEPYFLGVMLIGAYQETMGDLHNLFGRVHEAEVVLNPDGAASVSVLRRGESAAETCSYFGYDEDDLVECITAALDQRVRDGKISEAEAASLAEDFRGRLRGYTYLD